METYTQFKDRMITGNSELKDLPNERFRDLYKTHHGAFPEEFVRAKQSRKSAVDLSITPENAHLALDGVAVGISVVGCVLIGLSLLAWFFTIEMMALDWNSLTLIAVTAGMVISVVLGLLIVAAGQLLTVIGLIEQNTQKMSLLLEKQI
jgi:hypothetical protein